MVLNMMRDNSKRDDWIYLKPQQYRQISVSLIDDQMNRYCSLSAQPTTWLDNSPGNCLFFFFLLKRCISREQVVSQTLTITESDENLQIDPQFILVRRLIKRNNLAVTQLLMKWPNPLEEDASWEDYD